MTWIVRLRAHADGRILETASYGTPSAAMDAYRLLLGREDLVGEPLAAVFKPPRGAVGNSNTASWFSRFDRELGHGRIGPDDPRLDPFADAAAVHASLNSPSPVERREAVDWEADDRPFSDALKAWARTHGGRDAAAAELRVSRKTLDGWCDGRPAGQDKMARRLMTLIDKL